MGATPTTPRTKTMQMENNTGDGEIAGTLGLAGQRNDFGGRSVP
jgi:hypothetical protein